MRSPASWSRSAIRSRCRNRCASASCRWGGDAAPFSDASQKRLSQERFCEVSRIPSAPESLQADERLVHRGHLAFLDVALVNEQAVAQLQMLALGQLGKLLLILGAREAGAAE